MKALVKTRPGPGLELLDLPEPAVGPNDVRIAVRCTSICGTDIHIYEWDDWARRTVHLPLTLGHEFSGVIESIGSEVQGYRAGDRVSAEGHVTCGHCRNCRAGRRHLCIHTVSIGLDRPGAFAEYVTVPAGNLFKLPVQVSEELGAILDPLGNATHASLAFDLVGEDVLITGAGPIGIMSACIARFVGARHVMITDVSEYRLELARRVSGGLPLDVRKETIAQAAEKLGLTEGFDVGLEMSGQPSALDDLITAVHHGAGIALLGIPSSAAPVDWSRIIFKGLTIKGIYGREMFETWYKMVSMLQSGLSIEPLISHRFDAEQYEEAFELTRSGRSGKVILRWS